MRHQDILLYADRRARREESFAGILSGHPDVNRLQYFAVFQLGRDEDARQDIPVEDAIAIARQEFGAASQIRTSFRLPLPSGRSVWLSLYVRGDAYPSHYVRDRSGRSPALTAVVDGPFISLAVEAKDILLSGLEMPLPHSPNAGVEAAVALRLVHDDVDALVHCVAGHVDWAALGWPEDRPVSSNNASALYYPTPDALAAGVGLDVCGLDLVAALETVVVRDADGSRLDQDVDEILALVRRGVPTLHVPVTSRKHEQARRRTLRVHRLPDDGILVSTVPPDVLGPFFQEALTLLR